MGFRPHKEVSFEVVPQASAEVSHEMVAADEIAATGETAAVEERLIEAQALPSDTGLQFGSNPARMRRVYGAEIIQQRPIGLKSRIHIATGPPGDLTAKPEVVLQKIISGEHRIGSARQANRVMVPAGAGS